MSDDDKFFYSSEEIEYFKRFWASYRRWVYFNFDRIVADAVKQDRSVGPQSKPQEGG